MNKIIGYLLIIPVLLFGLLILPLIFFYDLVPKGK
jgi:hypothetical protein